MFLMLPFGPKLCHRIIPATSQTPPPLPEKYKPGSLEWQFVARGKNGTLLKGRVTAPDEAGYTETAKMVIESALSLALQEDEVRQAFDGKQGGVVTPAVLAPVLMSRLRTRGMTFIAGLE